MANVPKWGINTYHKRTRSRIGRHKKSMNKSEKRNYKPNVGQGR